MLRRIGKLLSHPAFRAEPFAVLARAATWAGCVPAGHRPVFTLTSSGERLRVPADMRYTSVATFLLRDWTEPELRQLQLFVRPGDVFVDVGANIGLFSLKAALIVGRKGRVIAVEPGLAASRLLTENLAFNDVPHVRQVRTALGINGQATLHHVNLGDDPQAFSLLSDGTDAEGENVPVTTLDALVAELGLGRMDCIKIDVEGAEERVIAGARQSLGRWHPTVILEANCPTLTDQGLPADGAWNRLRDFGYRFYLLADGAMSEVTRMPTEFGNIIARHPSR